MNQAIAAVRERTRRECGTYRDAASHYCWVHAAPPTAAPCGRSIFTLASLESHRRQCRRGALTSHDGEQSCCGASRARGAPSAVLAPFCACIVAEATPRSGNVLLRSRDSGEDGRRALGARREIAQGAATESRKTREGRKGCLHGRVKTNRARREKCAALVLRVRGNNVSDGVLDLRALRLSALRGARLRPPWLSRRRCHNNSASFHTQH
jgi:hypothetical protein